MPAHFDIAIFPPLLVHFLLTTVFSFIIGLELHSYRRVNKQDLGFGSTRTLMLIGVMGFALYSIDDRLLLYLGGSSACWCCWESIITAAAVNGAIH